MNCAKPFENKGTYAMPVNYSGAGASSDFIPADKYWRSVGSKPLCAARGCPRAICRSAYPGRRSGTTCAWKTGRWSTTHRRMARCTPTGAPDQVRRLSQQRLRPGAHRRLRDERLPGRQVACTVDFAGRARAAPAEEAVDAFGAGGKATISSAAGGGLKKIGRFMVSAMKNRSVPWHFSRRMPFLDAAFLCPMSVVSAALRSLL